MLATARIAGIMAAKRTHELIPLCHPLPLTQVTVAFRAVARSAGHLRSRPTVKVEAKTGVEMEALTAVSVACLTIYDMCKAADRAMTIAGIRLVEKTGGRSGTFQALMALLSVTDALARVPGRACPARGRARGARGGARPRARRGPCGAAHPAALRCLRHGRLCGARGRCGAPLPATLQVIGVAAAGHGFKARVGQGEAVRIFTGAPVPEGADTVVIQENTEEANGVVTIKEAGAAPAYPPARAGFPAKARYCSVPAHGSVPASSSWPRR